MTSAVATSSQPVAGSASSAVKQEEIILQYKAMRAELQRMAQKVGDLEGEKEEHRYDAFPEIPVLKIPFLTDAFSRLVWFWKPWNPWKPIENVFV